MTGVDEAEVERRLEFMTRMMSTHGGRLELESISDEGEVKIRFAGMCVGCLMKPITLNSLIRPALRDVAGVSQVEAIGVRLSEEAERRIPSFESGSGPLPYISLGGRHP